MKTKSKFKHIADERMIAVMKYVIANRINGITTQTDYCEAIQYLPTNIANVRGGKQSFSNENIRLCCEKFNVSADYIYGFSNEVHRSTSKQTPIQKIEAALRELKALK